MVEDVGAEHSAEGNTAYAVEIAIENGGGDETVVQPHKGHHGIADKEIGLSHGHIVLLAWLGRDEIENGGRSLHAKETAH